MVVVTDFIEIILFTEYCTSEIFFFVVMMTLFPSSVRSICKVSRTLVPAPDQILVIFSPGDPNQ